MPVDAGKYRNGGSIPLQKNGGRYRQETDDCWHSMNKKVLRLTEKLCCKA